VNDLIQHIVPDVTTNPELRSKIGAEPLVAHAVVSGLVNSQHSRIIAEENAARALDAGRGFAMNRIRRAIRWGRRDFVKQGP
jgi:hypothetical protein